LGEKRRQTIELNSESGAVPTGFLGELIVGKEIGALLRIR
jgi:hypothetical protein